MRINCGAIPGIVGVGIGALISTGAAYKNIKNENSALLENNSAIKKELYEDISKKEEQIKGLEKELLTWKKALTTDVFNKQVDSLNTVNPKKLNRQFYERTINSASLLDSINGNFKNMDAIWEKLPADTVMEIWGNSKMYTTKVAKNLLKYTKQFR